MECESATSHRAKRYAMCALICLILWPLTLGGRIAITAVFFEVEPQAYESSIWYSAAQLLNVAIWVAPFLSLIGSFVALRMRVAKRMLPVITAIGATVVLFVQSGCVFVWFVEFSPFAQAMS